MDEAYWLYPGEEAVEMKVLFIISSEVSGGSG